jgi:hypothetical protein
VCVEDILSTTILGRGITTTNFRVGHWKIDSWKGNRREIKKKFDRLCQQQDAQGIRRKKTRSRKPILGQNTHTKQTRHARDNSFGRSSHKMQFRNVRKKIKKRER